MYKRPFKTRFSFVDSMDIQSNTKKKKIKKYYKGLVTEEHISFNRIVYTMRFDPVYVQR